MAATQPGDERRTSEVQDRAADVDEIMVAVDTEPREDDGAAVDDRVELVRTGLTRVWIAGERYRLRRPFFGEFKALRLALQDANDEIAEAVDETLAVARRMTDEQKDQNVEDLDPDGWVAWRREARKRTNEASRALADVTESLRVEWWEQAWNLLTLDSRPPDWPSWVTDPNLHAAVIAHWRGSPLGRG